jgi:hypothetical protein
MGIGRGSYAAVYGPGRLTGYPAKEQSRGWGDGKYAASSLDVELSAKIAVVARKRISVVDHVASDFTEKAERAFAPRDVW